MPCTTAHIPQLSVHLLPKNFDICVVEKWKLNCRGNDTLSEQLPRAGQGCLLRFLVGTIPGSPGQRTDGDRAATHVLTSRHTNSFMQARGGML